MHCKADSAFVMSSASLSIGCPDLGLGVAPTGLDLILPVSEPPAAVNNTYLSRLGTSSACIQSLLAQATATILSLLVCCLLVRAKGKQKVLFPKSAPAHACACQQLHIGPVPSPLAACMHLHEMSWGIQRRDQKQCPERLGVLRLCSG